MDTNTVNCTQGLLFFTGLSSLRWLSSFQKLEVFTELHFIHHIFADILNKIFPSFCLFPVIILIDDRFLEFNHFLVKCWFQLHSIFIILFYLFFNLSGATPSAAFAIAQLKLTVSPLPHTPLASPSPSALFPLRFGSDSTCK